MTEPLVVIGGGEHARVVMDAARSRPDRYELLGFVDPSPPAATRALGVPWLGDDLDALRRGAEVRFVLGVGPYLGSSARAKVLARYVAAGARFGSVIHASAAVSPWAKVGDGVAVLANATVNAGAELGNHAVVNTAAVIEHDVVLGAGAHVGPGAVVGGGTRLGARTQVSLGASVRDHVTLGDDVVVGMGAVVVRSHGDGVTLVGVPAREVNR